MMIMMAETATATTVTRARVFSGYRRLFRARKVLFQGDIHAMQESRKAIKAEFVKYRAVEPAGEHWEGLLNMMDEAEDMIRHGIVRGDLNRTTGHYEVKFRPEHTLREGIPSVEPVTADLVSKLESPIAEVKVTQCKKPDT